MCLNMEITGFPNRLDEEIQEENDFQTYVTDEKIYDPNTTIYPHQEEEYSYQQYQFDETLLNEKDKIIEISSPEYSWEGEDIIKNTRKRIFGENKVSVKVERDNEIQIFEINPVKICNHRIILRQDNSLNAFADGKNIYITQGMLRFINEDKELQMVIAHELAHNIEGHIEKKTNNYLLGTIVDLAAAGAGVNTRGTFGSLGAQMYSQDFEREADYVGMYILANSGIEREGVANFWRRMSVENPRSISYASTHPSSSERWVNIEAVNKEIDKKILKSEPLLPERIQIED